MIGEEYPQVWISENPEYGVDCWMILSDKLAVAIGGSNTHIYESRSKVLALLTALRDLSPLWSRCG